MQLKAIKPHTFEGHRNVGDVYEADDRWADIMVRLGHAEPVQEKATHARKDMQAEAADKSEKRTYKRKDMQAEGGTK